MKILRLIWVTIIVSILTADALNNTNKCIFNKNCNSNCDINCQYENLSFELMIIKNINTEVDPCDDFYEYACGNFDNIKYNNRKNDRRDNFFTPLVKQIDQLKQLVKNSNSSNAFKPFNFIKNLITSCENLNINNKKSSSINITTKKDKLESLKGIISLLGGWPVIIGPEWNDTDFDIFEFTINSGNIGMDNQAVIFTHVELSIRNLWFLEIYPPQFNYLDNDGYKNRVNTYSEYIVSVAKFLGANETLARNELVYSLEFEWQLYNATIINNNYPSPLNITSNNNGISVKAAIEKWPNINWLKLRENYNLNNYSIIFIINPDYITKLDKLLKDTPKRVQANYVMWKMIDYLIPITESTTLYNLAENYYHSFGYGLGQLNCFDKLIELFPELVMAYWVRHYPVQESIKQSAYNLGLNIKHHLIYTINSTTLLDIQAKTDIIKHLDSVDFIFGATDSMLNETIFEQYFQGLEITPDDYLLNYLKTKAFIYKKLNNEIHKAENLRDLTILFRIGDIFASDARNYPFFARIVLDPGVMKDLYYSINRANYVNYATLGNLIAHELSHSVDNRYKNINKYRVNENNWSLSSNQHYKNFELCLIKQFNDYNHGKTNYKVDGVLTLDENIADNIGMEIAYSAYQNWIKKNGIEQVYYGSQLDANKLFWLSYANKYCHDRSTFDVASLQYTHSPKDKRVIGTLLNSPEFSKDFNCPLGSKMNPVEKCIFF